ncbi:MAG: RIP metalloprotease RseP [Deltaproteobacteria bacterium]
MYPVLAILSLAFLIVVHEGGHYFVARWCGMRIDRFSIGFGPGIFKRVSKKTGTTFQIAPIPFGGFVEIRGMNIAEEVDPEDRFAYPNRPAWQRFITIFAGPATNYISAIVVVFLLFTFSGVHSSWRFFGVAAVQPSSGAVGKLEVGDRILAVDHKPIIAVGEFIAPDGTHFLADDRDTLRGRVNVAHEVTVTVVRDGQRRDVTISPHFARDALGVLQTEDVPFVGCNHMSDTTIVAIEHYIPRKVFDCTPSYDFVDEHEQHVQRHKQVPFRIMGITPSLDDDYVHVGIFKAGWLALDYPIEETKEIGKNIYGIIAGHEKADPGGPKRIYDEFSKAWKLGWRRGIELLIALSVYLGLFNLFPLPALDGGRLVFLVYEMVTRRRANPRIEAMVHMGGIMVLGVVMILVTLRDCGVLFT